MVLTVSGPAGDPDVADTADLLRAFNLEYGEPAPPVAEIAARLAELIEARHVTALIARDPETGEAVGSAVLRIQPSILDRTQEAYLAELYVVPDRRGQGYGRALITEAIRVAREQGARTPSSSPPRTTGSPSVSTPRPASGAPRARAAR